MKRAAALLTALTLLCGCASGQGTQPAGAQEQNNPPTGAEEQSELQAGKEEQNEVPAETKDQSDLSASGINEIQISAEELPLPALCRRSFSRTGRDMRTTRSQ